MIKWQDFSANKNIFGLYKSYDHLTKTKCKIMNRNLISNRQAG